MFLILIRFGFQVEKTQLRAGMASGAFYGIESISYLIKITASHGSANPMIQSPNTVLVIFLAIIRR